MTEQPASFFLIVADHDQGCPSNLINGLAGELQHLSRLSDAEALTVLGRL